MKADPVGRNRACPCGSGKKFKRCCGSDVRPVGASSSASALLRDAFSSLERGRLLDAESACRRLLQIKDTHAEALYLLGHVLQQLGDSHAALHHIRKAIECGLADPAAHYHFANLLLSQGDVAGAEAEFRRALLLKPEFAEARLHLANLYFQEGDFALAEPEFRRIVETDPDAHAARYNLAHTLYQQQRIPEAIEALNALLDRSPSYPLARGDLANLLEQNNQLSEAREAVTQALTLDPGNTSALLVQARLQRRAGDLAEATATLERILSRAPSGYVAMSAWNERGKILDQRLDAGGAFQAFSRSRDMLKSLRPPSNETQQLYDRLDRMTTWFDASEKLAILDKRVAPAAPAPVFLVGINRSGTSLLEQMLASHPAFAAGGEMELIPNAMRSLECNTLFPDRGIEERDLTASLVPLREAYLKQSRNLASADANHRWVTDKLPHNLFYLPLIRMLFPEARIVHIVRHPLDTVISNFSQIYLHRNEWSYDIDSIIELHVRAFAFSAHMAPLLGNNYYRIHYESLVREPEEALPKLMQFLDERMDVRMLDFHRNKRVVRTASYAQVNQPLYTTSIDKAGRYVPFLDPIHVAKLLPLIERLGYALAVPNP